VRLPIAVKERVTSEFPGTTIFLTGCSADGCRRDYCEYNISAYPAKGKTKALENAGQIYIIQPVIDIKRILASPHKVIYDPEWNMAKILGSRVKEKIEIAKKEHTKEVEVKATFNIIESFSLLEKEKIKASSLYFVSSISSISELMLIKRSVIPHPSHLASQLRERSLLAIFAEAASFDFPSSTNAERRMNKISSSFTGAEAVAIKRKMEGMINSGNIFDSLYYSYWCISNLLKMKGEGAYAIAEGMGITAEENHLRKHLPTMADTLKQLIKSNTSL